MNIAKPESVPDVEISLRRLPSAEEILAGLERLLASESFAASAQLSRFLRYVVENGLPGMVTQLKESVIGVAVFHRGAAYDPKTDPVVRVEARRLRARLEEYYSGAGAGEPVRISLPKGGYVPAFELMAATEVVEQSVPEAIAVPEQEQSEAGGTAWRWVAIVAAVVLAASAIGIYAVTKRESHVSRFWSTILQGDRPAVLIPADSGLVMLQNLAKRPVTLQEYMTGEYRAHLSSQSKLDPGVIYNLAGRRYTSIADLEFASRLAHRPETVKRGLVTRYARDVRVGDLKGLNVILLGARMSNPWVELFEKDATFRLDDDSATEDMRIINLTPREGEPTEIVMSPERMRSDIYGIITYHRNRDGSGMGLVVAGMTVAGTEAAADFLLDDSRFLPWLRKAEAGGEFGGFDILLRGRNLAGSVPRAEVISMHVER